MKISIMQPYFFPYFGYFKMINYVDKFVFYDDVNYIKNGWINRNKILLNGSEYTFTIPIKNQSSFRKINETYVDWNSKSISKIMKTFTQEYRKKNSVLLEGILNIMESKPETISELSINSIEFFCKYLDVKTELKKSSDIEFRRSSCKVENIINICNKENCNEYINPPGGMNIYSKSEFSKFGIFLNFIKTDPSMSIIDVCMNGNKEDLKNSLRKIDLI